MRTGVVLFNLGGPDSLEAVQPFLKNLFSDPAIIRVPGPLRWLLAHLISRRRAGIARAIYARIGGRSPLREQTYAQATALEKVLQAEGPAKVVVAMRYWHPFADEAAASLAAFRPERIVLLPLYPQYSTTTTASSVIDWRRSAARTGLADVPTHTVCCYPVNTGFIEAQVRLMRSYLDLAATQGRPRVLFSAHGLPKRVVDDGDPYPELVNRTASAILARLDMPDLDHVVCYQSRVGPLEWIAPSTDAEIDRAGRDRVPVVVVPLAFVSEHSETLVELDLEYGERARHAGVPAYHRVPTVQSEPMFIDGLAGLVREALERPGVAAEGCGRQCSAAWRRCAMALPERG